MAFLFFASFAFYLIGLSGTVPAYRDSGDLIASIHTLGIAHPPGYAFYILVGKLFVTLLPFGNVAYRVNVMSAFFSAISVCILFKVARQVFTSQQQEQRDSFAPTLLAGGVTALYAASPAVVALSRVAEMYTLSACLAAGILYFLLSGRPQGLAHAALLLGLGLSVHPTLLFLFPLFAAKLIDSKRSELRHAAFYLLLGLSVFLYLPIRASQHPIVNWGDPSQWRNFWRVVTRADYGGLKLHPEESLFSWTPASIVHQLRYFTAALKNEWGWTALFLGFLGGLLTLRSPQHRRWAVGLALSWLLAGPGFFLLSNLPLHEETTPAILQPYLLLVNVLWVPFVWAGCQAIWARRPSSSWVAWPIAIALVAGRPWSWVSERNDFYAYDYARNLLRSLPADAVLYDPDDPTYFSMQVLQTVENRRPDVALVSFYRTRWGYELLKRRWPDLLPPIPIDSGQELQRLLWSYSAQRRHFYAELPQKFGPIPYRAEGLVYASQVGPYMNSETASLQRAETLLDIYTRRGDAVVTHHRDFFTRHLIDYYAAAHCNLGLAYAAAKNTLKAVEHYRLALDINPELSAAYNNWGIIAFDRQDYPEASRLFSRGLAIDPKNEMLRKNAQLALQKMSKLL